MERRPPPCVNRPDPIFAGEARVLELNQLKARLDHLERQANHSPSSSIQRSDKSSKPLKRAAMIGNFPPRKCGIATFTRDMLLCMRAASPSTGWDVVAMNDSGSAYDYPAEVTQTLPQDDPAAYLAIAEKLNGSGAEVAFIQHEFGIFGGPAGDYLLLLMRRLRIPIVVTLHTVLEHPDADQRRVMDEIIRLASSIVVMAKKGSDILCSVHKADKTKIVVVPHGAPERPLTPTEPYKAVLGLAGQPTIMTFGLLSPNKGLETIIRAMPRILERHPDAVYMIVGATHPHLVAREGETYRDGLIEVARTLGVDHSLRFVNRFVSDEELIDLLQAADIYATPYLTENQITSGTLSYAIALGKPVLSTPYWHAVEALADGVGVLCPFGDVDAFARELTDILSNDVRREAMARKAWRTGSASRWPNVAHAYIELAAGARNRWATKARQTIGAYSRPSLTAVRRLVDEVGVIQHGKFRVPDRAHGYCVDDTARALSYFARLNREAPLADAEAKMALSCAAFVNHSWNEDVGRFRNFMSWDRRWLDDGGCDDCNGRAFDALCQTAAHGLDAGLRAWAADLGRNVFQHANKWTSLRARAHLIKACVAAEDRVLDAREVQETLKASLLPFVNGLTENSTWFEPNLSYDNARLPEAMILAGSRLGDRGVVSKGLAALEWLMVQQTAPEGHFRPVATSGFASSDASHAAFDQQPIEALASVEACATAFAATGDEKWRRMAIASFFWFVGENDLGLSLITPEDGGCYDGLTSVGCNLNQGAESVLSYHLSAVRVRELNGLSPA